MLFDPRRGRVPECLFSRDDASECGGWFGRCHGEGDRRRGRCGRESHGARWKTGAATATAAASACVSTAAAGVLLSAAVSAAGRLSAAGLWPALPTAAAVSLPTSAAATAASGAMVSGALVSVCAAAAVVLAAQNEAGSRNTRFTGFLPGFFSEDVAENGGMNQASAFARLLRAGLAGLGMMVGRKASPKR